MTLDEFVQRAPAAVEAFAAMTRAAVAEGQEGFVGPRFEDRTEVDWWAEVAAYYAFTELSEIIAQGGPIVERRKHKR